MEERRRDFKEIWQTMARTEQKVDNVVDRVESLTNLISPKIKGWDNTSSQVYLLMKVIGAIGISVIGVIVKLIFE